MNQEEIKHKLISVCSDVFANSNVDVDMIEYLDIKEDLGMDSITFITLLVEIEAMFDITIPDDLLLLDKFKNIDDIVKLVVEQLCKKL